MRPLTHPRWGQPTGPLPPARPLRCSSSCRTGSLVLTQQAATWFCASPTPSSLCTIPAAAHPLLLVPLVPPRSPQGAGLLGEERGARLQWREGRRRRQRRRQMRRRGRRMCHRCGMCFSRH